MKLPLSIIISDDQIYEGTACDDTCPFLSAGKSCCTLFNSILEDIELPMDFTWNDETEPNKRRCFNCCQLEVALKISILRG